MGKIDALNRLFPELEDGSSLAGLIAITKATENYGGPKTQFRNMLYETYCKFLSGFKKT